MNEIVLNYIIILIVLEVYEAQWQKAQTMMGMLARMYEHYQRNCTYVCYKLQHVCRNDVSF